MLFNKKKKSNKSVFKVNMNNINKKFQHMFRDDYVPKRYNVYYGGSGSGKSHSLLQMFIKMCMTTDNTHLLIARKIGATVNDTVAKPMESIMLEANLIKGKHYNYNKTERYVKFSTGSSIKMIGYDCPEKLKGIANINVLWIEESTDFTKKDLGMIIDRLRSPVPKSHPWYKGKKDKRIKVFISFNPVFKGHWIREYFFEEDIDTSRDIHKDTVRKELIDDVFALKTTYRDNKFYNGKYKNNNEKEFERKINPLTYNVYCNGNWGVLGELIYKNNYEIIDCIQDEEYYSYEIAYGCDYGYQHPTGVVKVAMKDGDLYVLKEIKEKKLTNTPLAEKMLRVMPNSYWYRCYCDSSRPETVSHMIENGINKAVSCKKGGGSVIQGIEWIQDRTIYIDRRCTKFIDEIQSYQYRQDKTTGKYKQEPVKENDDLMDAFRYATEEWRVRIDNSVTHINGY